MTIVDPTTRRIRLEFQQVVIGVLLAADLILAAALTIVIAVVAR